MYKNYFLNIVYTIYKFKPISNLQGKTYICNLNLEYLDHIFLELLLYHCWRLRMRPTNQNCLLVKLYYDHIANKAKILKTFIGFIDHIRHLLSFFTLKSVRLSSETLFPLRKLKILLLFFEIFFRI